MSKKTPRKDLATWGESFCIESFCNPNQAGQQTRTAEYRITNEELRRKGTNKFNSSFEIPGRLWRRKAGKPCSTFDICFVLNNSLSPPIPLILRKSLFLSIVPITGISKSRSAFTCFMTWGMRAEGLTDCLDREHTSRPWKSHIGQWS